MKIDRSQIITGSLFILILIIIYILSKRNAEEKEKSISINKIQSICLVYDFQSNRSFSRYYYKFYFEGKEYLNSENIIGEGKEKCIGRYYRIVFSSQETKFSKIFLKKEVTDSIEIANAGFKLK